MGAEITIRQLRAGDPIPTGEPKRYRSSHGYIRLRWRVGTRQYIEVYEHRLIAGLNAPEVHHKNHRKDDNTPANLQPVSKIEHGAEHSAIEFAEAARLYSEGLLFSQVAERFGVDSSTMFRFLTRRGIAPRSLAEAGILRGLSRRAKRPTCLQGHPFTLVPTTKNGLGTQRICRICRNRQQREKYAATLAKSREYNRLKRQRLSRKAEA